MIWDGNLHDTSDFVSDKFLEVNSCGFQNMSTDFTTVRENGRHDYHILLLTSGVCTAYHSGRKYNLLPVTVLIYFPKERQQYSFKKNSKSLWCHFSGTAVEELFSGAAIRSGVYKTTPNDTVLGTFYKMIERFNVSERSKFAIPLLIELIYRISDAVHFSDKREISAAISRTLLYIHSNYNKDINVEELAKVAGYSKSRFSHLFVAESGTTPIAYQNDIRLKLSCEMLIATEKSILEIAYDCGYNDPLYFSRIFKRRYHLTPTEYRSLYSVKQ